MIRIIEHIAILLIGIFIFPLAFQSIHIAGHQYHIEHTSHITCHTDAKTIWQEDESCAICDYEFSINDLPQSTHLNTINVFIKSSETELAIRILFQNLFSAKSPRAPPAYFC